MKTLRLSRVIVAVGLLLGSCTPSNVAPPGAIGYGNSFVPFVSTPLAARVHQATDPALGLRLGPEGLGFQVTDGPWGAELIVPPRGGTAAFVRGSYVQGRFTLALSLAGETYYYDGSQYVTQSVNGGGLGLEVGYFWPINLETGGGYFGPRVYSYITCQSRNNAPLSCTGPRINPGFTVGVNLELGRFAVAPEIGVFLLPPDEYYASPRLASPFSLSLSFRF